MILPAISTGQIPVAAIVVDWYLVQEECEVPADKQDRGCVLLTPFCSISKRLMYDAHAARKIATLAESETKYSVRVFL